MVLFTLTPATTVQAFGTLLVLCNTSTDQRAALHVSTYM